MPLPEGYLPRKGDIVLVQARAKRDSTDIVGEREIYLEIVGYEHHKLFVESADVHSLYRRQGNEGDRVSAGDFEGPGTVIAVDENEVWVRDTQGLRWTIYANDLGPWVEPALDVMSTIDANYAESFEHPMPPAPGSQSVVGNDEEIAR